MILRHLTTSQRAMIGARAKEQYAKLAKERMKAGGGDKKSGVEIVAHPIANKGDSRDQAGAGGGAP